MKKISVFLFSIFLIFFTSKEIKASSPSYIHGYFYSNLTSYGTWISIDFGVYAWRPTIIARTWAPYKIGRWIWTDYGWYWDSYEPFGFIVYHYGRWHYDDYYGWIWIPDYEWAPAWVEWRYNDNYIGWAPLPPYAIFRISVGIVYTHSFVIPVSHWNFVRIRYFGSDYAYNYYVPEKTKYRIYSNTKFRNDYIYSDGRIRNAGVEFDFVRQRTGDNIRKRDLVITDDPRNFESNRNRNREQITTFIADRDKILTDRESLRNVDVTRNERKTSLDLSRVELGEIRNRDEVRNREDVSTITRENNRESRQRNDQIKDNERRDSERRDIERRKIERIESERREIERRESERHNNQIIEQRRNENLEQRKNESRENELNRQNQREQERRNNSWISPNTEQQRGSKNIEERRIEQNNNQRNESREIRTQQKNENSRNESNREDVNRDRRQNTEQRQRSR